VARRAGIAVAVESAGGYDDDEQSENGDQIDLTGIVTPVADFPAHDFALATEALNQCAVETLVPGTAAMQLGVKAVQQMRCIPVMAR
jgi:hypothetical protein